MAWWAGADPAVAAGAGCGLLSATVWATTLPGRGRRRYWWLGGERGLGVRRYRYRWDRRRRRRPGPGARCDGGAPGNGDAVGTEVVGDQARHRADMVAALDGRHDMGHLTAPTIAGGLAVGFAVGFAVGLEVVGFAVVWCWRSG